jgi:hypothetical protein
MMSTYTGVDGGFPLGPTGVTKYQGRSYDFYNKLGVTWSNFGGGNNGNPDLFIPFETDTVQLINLTVDQFIPASSSGALAATSVVEYSFNGTQVHGELGSGVHNIERTFIDRVIGLIWFRIQAGSTGPIVVTTQAWGIR